MEIGEPRRTLRIEPLESPVRAPSPPSEPPREPAEGDERADPVEVPARS